MSRLFLGPMAPTTSILRSFYRPCLSTPRGLCTSSHVRLALSRPCLATTVPPGGNHNNNNDSSNSNSNADEADDMSVPSALAQSEMRQAALRAVRKRAASIKRPETKQDILSAPSKFSGKKDPVPIEEQPLSKWETRLFEHGMHPHDFPRSPDPTITPDGSELGESEGFYSEQDRKIRAEWREYWRQQSVRYLRRLHRLEERRMAAAVGYKSLEEAKAAGFKYSPRAMGEGEAILPQHPAPSRTRRIVHAGLVALLVVSVLWLTLYHDWGSYETFYSPLRRWIGTDTNVYPKASPDDDRPLLDTSKPRPANMTLAEYYYHLISDIGKASQLKAPPTYEQQLEAKGMSAVGTPYHPDELKKIMARIDAKKEGKIPEDPPNVYLLDDDDISREEAQALLNDVKVEAEWEGDPGKSKSWFSWSSPKSKSKDEVPASSA